MNEAYSPTTFAPARPDGTSRWLPLALLWQALVGLVGLGAVGAFLTRPDLLVVPVPLRFLFAALVGSAAIASLVSIPLIRHREHRGRVCALVVNYLLFLALLFYNLHRLGLFVGIDRLGESFSRGLPFLAIVLLGWLLQGLSDRYEAQPARAHLFIRLGRTIMLGGGIAALLAVGLLQALLALLATLLADPVALLLTLFALLFGLVTWFWWQTETGLYFNASISQNEMLNGYLLLSPNLLGFLIFFAGPLLFSLYVSLTDWSAFGSPRWVGFENYQKLLSFDVAPLTSPGVRGSDLLSPPFIELFRLDLFGRGLVVGARDHLFWIALRNTFAFCLMVVPLSVIPALLLANLLNSKIPGMRLFRAIYFLPSVAAVVGVAVIWNWLYNSSSGFINFGISNLIQLVNLLPGVALADPKIPWLSSSRTALPAIALMAAWRIVGFNTVLFLAGLQGIPREIYEAAEVDGADLWRKFRSITIPLLAPTTFFVVTTTVIQALQVFDEVFVLMNPPAGPNNSTLTAVLYLYQSGFQNFSLGYASAVAWLLFLIIFIVTVLQFRLQRAGADIY